MHGSDPVLREVGTTALLKRASEIDPEAWAPPLPKQLGRRRDRSVAEAFREMLGRRAALSA
jgi:hypothetical protein